MYKNTKNAIALLITVLFVIVITVAIGFGLRQVNDTAQIIKDESFMYQSSVMVEDVLEILKSSPDIARAADSNSSEELFALLSQAGFIPFESAGVSMVLKLHSARAKLNPNGLSKEGVEGLREYMSLKMANNQYVDLLLDAMRGIKVDSSYNSRIFDEKPYLFRDYIASSKHLNQVNDFYAKEYNDNALNKIAFEELFYYNSDANMSVDLNYATPEVWELLVGATPERAKYLHENAGLYSDLDSLELDRNELERLGRFKTSFFEPVLFVEIEIRQGQSSAYVSFEYDISNKKGSNFVYEI